MIYSKSYIYFPTSIRNTQVRVVEKKINLSVTPPLQCESGGSAHQLKC